MPEGRILLVDDEESVRLPLRRFLDSQGFEVLEADSLDATQAVLRQQQVDAAIVDFRPVADALAPGGPGAVTAAR